METRFFSEDVEVQIGRADSGTFIRVLHTPTGKSRTIVGLDSRSCDEVVREQLAELEREVLGSESAPAKDNGATNES
jgi:hypothetical protein